MKVIVRFVPRLPIQEAVLLLNDAARLRSRWIGSSWGRSNVVWIIAIATISVVVAIYSFTQASRGLDRVVTMSDARKTARQTLVALLDEEAALHVYSSAKRKSGRIAFQQARTLERRLHEPLRHYVVALDGAPTTAAFAGFETAKERFTKNAITSIEDQRAAIPDIVFSDIRHCRKSLNVLINAFNAAEEETVVDTKLRLLLAGILSASSTVLFGGAMLLAERLRHRLRMQRSIELENTLVERERANAALTRANLLQAGNSALEHEIVERKQVEERLAFAAFHDELTGLANRALFMNRLNEIVAQEYTADHRWAVLFLDLDRFKVVNDSLGHLSGDMLLVAVARRLERCLRDDDILARLGGDEFTILLDDIEDDSVAFSIAQRVLRELEQAFSIAGRDVFATASIGIATSRNADDRPEDVLRNADIAMYRAKELGKQRYVLFSPELHARAVSLLDVETDLARALERDEFRLHYQPVVALRDGRLVGFEALVRWQHPTRGLVSPDQFISIAEETGSIVAIGEWVLRQACRQTQIWRTTIDGAENLRINVNASAKQFACSDFTSTVASALSASGLPPDGLNLEITESVIMNNAAEARVTLAQLRRRGIHMHLDDFGTGYSSLAYLHAFPIDTLKIDRSFVSTSGPDLASLEIVQTIIALARSLSISVTAEGIETENQLAALRALGCESGQGYHFSRPVDALTAERIIAAHVAHVYEPASAHG